MKVLNLKVIFLSYFIVICSFFQKTSDETSLLVTFYNYNSYDLYLCWISPSARESEIIQKSPEGCYIMDANGGIRSTTYKSHRFLILPSNKTLLNTKDRNNQTISPIFISIDLEPKEYHILFNSSDVTDNNNNNVNYYYKSSNHFQWNSSYIWNYILLRFRHEVMVIVIILLATWNILNSSFTTKTKIVNNNNNNKNDNKYHQLAIPRQGLKSFATIMMLLNHASYIFLRSYPSWMKLGTIPADLAGSSHLYYWLVGYNMSNNNRSYNLKVLLVLFSLEQFCRLPSPFTYESLLTVVILRHLLSIKLFDYFLLNYSIFFHSILIFIFIQLNPIFNGEGLRLCQMIGVIYAISGRMFVISSDPYKNMLWLFAGSGHIIFKMVSVNSFDVIDLTSSLQVLLLSFSLTWYCLHILLFSFPLENPFWKSNSSFTIFFSRYSLEIYVVHLFLAYFYHLYINNSKNN